MRRGRARRDDSPRHDAAGRAEEDGHEEGILIAEQDAVDIDRGQQEVRREPDHEQALGHEVVLPAEIAQRQQAAPEQDQVADHSKQSQLDPDFENARMHIGILPGGHQTAQEVFLHVNTVNLQVSQAY